MASLVVAMEKTYDCYGTNIQEMRRKNSFNTRLLDSEKGGNDGKINFSPYLPDLPSTLSEMQASSGNSQRCICSEGKFCVRQQYVSNGKLTLWVAAL